MKQVYNFSAGPAMIPTDVMQQAQAEFLNWKNLGMSVMEISHRGSHFLQMVKETEQDLRDLLNLSSDYHVLFLPGGARGQFAAIPMNLLDEQQKVAYIKTGAWSQYAIKEAKHYAEVDLVVDNESSGFTTIPNRNEWRLPTQNTAYVHYTDNETIHGIEFPYIPEVGDIPLVCDMSSNVLSRPINVDKYGLIYASSQKNLGMAGITLVIIRADLLKRKPLASTPSIFRYAVQVEKESMLNTPPTYSWYMCGLVLKWLKKQGGLAAMAERNRQKVNKLYQYIDQSNLYSNPVDSAYRSRMNVIFMLKMKELEQDFLKQAEVAGLVGLKGHRDLGGMRASIYNAMPEEGVDALIQFMTTFEQQNG